MLSNTGTKVLVPLKASTVTAFPLCSTLASPKPDKRKENPYIKVDHCFCDNDNDQRAMCKTPFSDQCYTHDMVCLSGGD